MAKVFFGQFAPNHNVRCQMTGKTFGPTMPKKVGYKVTVENNGEKHSYVVWGREQAMQIRENAEKASEGDIQ